MVTKPEIGSPNWGPVLNEALDELQLGVNSAQAGVDGLQVDMSAVQGDVGDLQTSVTTLQGQVGGGPYYYLVAASDAPATVRAKADYTCDGSADDEEIQIAINAAKAGGGGIVQLSGGHFVLANTLTLTGNTDEDNAATLTLRGAGAQATTLTAAWNTNGIELTNWAMVNIEDLGIVVSGSGSCIHSTAVLSGNEVSFWHSSFRNLRLNGSYTPTNTGWGMDLAMPWRSTFENIEVEGTRNGMRLSNQGTVQNAGDNTFTRMFIEIVGTGGTGIHVSSPSNNMNQNNFSMVELGANGAGCTGILIDGASGGASQRFWGLNAEQFQTTVHVANGESNVFDCNYVTCDGGDPANVMFKCGSNAYNNVFSAKWVNVESGGTLKVIEDANTTSNCPNIFERIRIENNSGATVTYSKTSNTVLRDITTFNTGSAMPAGLLQYPLTTVNNPEFTADDHGFLSWSIDPTRCTVASSAATTHGVIHLTKLKVVNRATVVTNLVASLATGGVTLTAGQCFAGLYNSSGTLLAATADQAAAWATAGVKTMALSSPQTLAVGTYWVALLTNGGGAGVQFVADGGGFAGTTNAGTSRSLTSGTTQTALPASITLGSAANHGYTRFVALT
ncbi:hypothetical protein [Streptomyces rochei]|uniref:hypothetical protein n=1 Tax=Streptomyces rochei TaxID=1928 RepID=UPI0036F76C8C